MSPAGLLKVRDGSVPSAIRRKSRDLWPECQKGINGSVVRGRTVYLLQRRSYGKVLSSEYKGRWPARASTLQTRSNHRQRTVFRTGS